MIFKILVLLSIISPVVIGLDHLYTFCSNDTLKFDRGDQFAANLKRVLDHLSSNIMRNGSFPGFYNSPIEITEDEVFGQALCRGDVIRNETCQSCVATASRDIFENCTRKSAVIWYDICQLRYSFQNIVGSMTYTGKFPEGDQLKKPVSDNPNRFQQVLNALMKDIINKAAYTPSNRMFGTGNVKVSRNQTIFGLVQCTLDLSPDYCSNCLTSALGDLDNCCSFLEGGFVVSRTCSLRFEIYQFYNETSKFYPRSKGEKRRKKILGAATSASASLLAIFLCVLVVILRQKKRADKELICEHVLVRELASTTVTISKDGKLLTSEELHFMDLATVTLATNDFAVSNKLGEGGFGSVYKGVFQDGKELAVKRLSRKSSQGLEEFKNEIMLLAKLQHRNLTSLVGCSFEGEEKLLLYEFMPNRSLDFLIFDSERRSILQWETYYNIINGISKGLIYLHEDSRLKIIHRDLKPSNVLLDHDMVAKISDFGMARIFCENQKTANTKRLGGTFGYMAPEYAMGGIFSVKSDVFSFGVILLEIISGQKNNGFYLTEKAQTLLSYAWKLWKEEKELEFVDPMLIESKSCPIDDVRRCIHVGLLCVQEDPADRPTMREVAVLLRGSESMISSLPQPREPAFAVGRFVQTQHSTADPTVTETTASVVLPR